MEFCALGCYLASDHGLANGKIHQSPWYLQNLILKEWLAEFYPSASEKPSPPKPLEHLDVRFNNTPTTASDFLNYKVTDKKIYEMPETR